MECNALCLALWTVVASYCPDGIDGHRTLGEKPGLAGKRDMAQDDDFRTGLSVTHRNGTIVLRHP